MTDTLLILLMVCLLLLAAWRDIATRLIPDSLCLALLVGALAIRASAGPEALLLSLGAALFLFGLLLVLAMRGILGGGDVKLAGAFAVALPPASIWNFAIVTVFAGGALGLSYIAAARLLPASASSPGAQGLLGRVLAVESWRIRRRGPLPYAVAIAAGGIIVLLGSRGL
jgi:prepilin peptidase CpaA